MWSGLGPTVPVSDWPFYRTANVQRIYRSQAHKLAPASITYNVQPSVVERQCALLGVAQKLATAGAALCVCPHNKPILSPLNHHFSGADKPAKASKALTLPHSKPL